MNELQQRSVELAKSFYAAKERHDLDATVDLFSEDIIYTVVLNASGEPSTWFEYRGKADTAKFQKGALTRFSQIKMVDLHYTVNHDGSVVFVEARGDYIEAESKRTYKNVYVYKFVVLNGKFTHIYGYANPVTFAKFAGLPIG